jgi:hypothetical protein
MPSFHLSSVGGPVEVAYMEGSFEPEPISVQIFVGDIDVEDCKRLEVQRMVAEVERILYKDRFAKTSDGKLMNTDIGGRSVITKWKSDSGASDVTRENW